MRKLASNDKALLVKCGKEYWIVYQNSAAWNKSAPWDTSAINEASDTFRAKDALAYFTEHYGPPTWTHENIGWY